MTLIILFLIALVVFVGLTTFGLRAYKNRMIGEPAPTLADIESSVLYSAKRFGHIIILIVMKYWIKYIHVIVTAGKKIWSKSKEKVQAFGVWEHEHVQSAKAYIKRLRRIAEKLKEEHAEKE